eukprot:TCONS_00022566-protein
MSINTVIEYSLVVEPDKDLDRLHKECLGCISTDIQEYLWHKEEFCLNATLDFDNSGLAALYGSTDVGENINDEWFIVHLLFKLSKKFPRCIIQVTDTDDNFLLIEAAEYLPRWLKPETSDNRVFIYNGNLHLIPFPSNPSEVTIYPTGKPTLQQAFKILTNDDEAKTCACPKIQECLNARIKDYPSKIQKDFHHAHCYLPLELIYMLHKQPALVAAAVEAFYNRDHIDIKTCKSLPSFTPNKQALSRVKFTKHLYCQLAQARFVPERRSPWQLPTTNDTTYKSKELGYKLACGFEILLSRYQMSQKDGQPHGKQWQSFLENLKKNDFFQGEMEGSKKYKEFMSRAKEHFKEHIKINIDSFGKDLLKLYEEVGHNEPMVKNLASKLLPEDDDSWMTVTPEELDQMMLGAWGRESTNQKHGKNDVENLSHLVDNMKLFVDKVSSYEGVETPQEVDVNQDSGRAGAPSIDDEIQFDPKAFMENISNLLSPPSQYASEKVKEGFQFSDSDDDSIDDDFVTCKDDDVIDKNDVSDESGFYDVIGSMDDELKGTSIPRSFQSQEGEEGLNYDVNLIRNFLESFQSQDGLAGPVSNILQSMGMSLPPNEDGTKAT